LLAPDENWLISLSKSHNATEQANIEAQFEVRAGIPNVIGAIDCTHCAIKAPSHDEFVYQQETFSKCFVGGAWFNARFIHSVTELLGTDYKVALCAMGGFLVSNFIRLIVLILFPVTCIEHVRPQFLSHLHSIIVGG